MPRLMDNGYHNTTADSAMTEVALALAMGFFSIMVLTMVSMGTGSPVTAKVTEAARLADAAVLQPPQRIARGIVGEAGAADDQAVHGRRLVELPGLDPALPPATEPPRVRGVEFGLAVPECANHGARSNPGPRQVNAPRA